MAARTFAFGTVSRCRTEGGLETLYLEPGINLLVGAANTGKTQWLRLLDYMLGCPDPFESRFSSAMSHLYKSCEAELVVAGRSHRIERNWYQQGLKSKVRLNGDWMPTREFQHFLMEGLGIPTLRFPKGNLAGSPMFVELSFRTILRHMYRQQRFWTEIAGKQIDSEVGACILLFIGLAEEVFSEQLMEGLSLRNKADQLAIEKTGYVRALQSLLCAAESERKGDDPEKELRSLDTRYAGVSVQVDHLKRSLSDPSRAVGADFSCDVEELIYLAGKMGVLQERSRAIRILLECAERAQAQIESLGPRIDELRRSAARTDLAERLLPRLARLGDAMNEYLDRLNALRPNIWRHHPVKVRSYGRSDFAFRIGALDWTRALGGTDSLYLLMAYHYALMAMTMEAYSHYPGFCIIDFPADFSGETIADREADLVQPFIELFANPKLADAQLIAAGTAFGNLGVASTIKLREAYSH